MLTLPEAQRITGKVDQLDEIDATVSDGQRRRQAVKRGPGRGARPDACTCAPAREEAASQSKDIRDNLGFLQTALLAFAGISLFVGAFIIFNTFSITVAQRTREFGAAAHARRLARARSCARCSPRASCSASSARSSASLLGIGLAAGPARAVQGDRLRPAVQRHGHRERTIIVSMLVGIVVTLIATLAPAIRATRVPPVAALREGFVRLDGPPLADRDAARIAVLLLGGLALMALGLFGTGSSNRDLTFVGVGAGLMFLGVALLSPRLVPPIAAADRRRRCAGSPAAWRARTRCASPAAPPRPRRR